MRTSVRENDPGYITFQKNGGYGVVEVLLDGKPVDLVITADEEQGYILAFEPGPDGKPYWKPEFNVVPERILHGKVEIRKAAAIRRRR
jgi:hypothetical protein